MLAMFAALAALSAVALLLVFTPESMKVGHHARRAARGERPGW
jgi:hypothetical protein